MHESCVDSRPQLRARPFSLSVSHCLSLSSGAHGTRDRCAGRYNANAAGAPSLTIHLGKRCDRSVHFLHRFAESLRNFRVRRGTGEFTATRGARAEFFDALTTIHYTLTQAKTHLARPRVCRNRARLSQFCMDR